MAKRGYGKKKEKHITKEMVRSVCNEVKISV